MVLRAREKVCAIFTTQEGNERGMVSSLLFFRADDSPVGLPFAIDCKFRFPSARRTSGGERFAVDCNLTHAGRDASNFAALNGRAEDPRSRRPRRSGIRSYWPTPWVSRRSALRSLALSSTSSIPERLCRQGHSGSPDQAQALRVSGEIFRARWRQNVSEIRYPQRWIDLADA